MKKLGREFTPEEKRVIKRIREVIDEVSGEMGIKVDRVILFGSRVRGDYREDSDWDILVVVEEEDRKRRDDFWLRVHIKLVNNKINADLIVDNKEDVDEYAKYFGFVHHHAMKEGVMI